MALTIFEKFTSFLVIVYWSYGVPGFSYTPWCLSLSYSLILVGFTNARFLLQRVPKDATLFIQTCALGILHTGSCPLGFVILFLYAPLMCVSSLLGVSRYPLWMLPQICFGDPKGVIYNFHRCRGRVSNPKVFILGSLCLYLVG